MIVLWLERHDVFFWYFLLINSVTSGITAYNVNVFKKTWDNTWISFPHHRNQFQTSIKFFFRSKVELMLSLAILNRLKNFTRYFLMFAISWIYWKIELLQNVNMKRNNKLYWYVKKFSFDYLLASLCIIFQPNHYPQLVNTVTK